MEKQVTINQPIKVRQSGLELLRILTACAVVMLHYNDGKAFTYVADGTINKYILFFLESVCICAVDLFILISSYFLCKTNKRSFGKILDLFIQVILFNVAMYLFIAIIGHTDFSINTMLKKLVPNNYFVMLYSALYFISPYINIIFEKLSSKEWKRLMITIVILFSVWPTLVDLIKELSGGEWNRLSTIGAWGNQQGFTIVNFTLMYCIGGYLRYNNIPEKVKKNSCIWTIILCLIVVFSWSILNNYTYRDGLRSAWVYHNPFVILIAVCTFILFLNMTFKSKVTNELAKGSFTCFLVHAVLLSYIKISFFAVQQWYIMLVHIAISLTLIYLLSWVAYKVYNLVVGRFVQQLNKLSVPNVEE